MDNLGIDYNADKSWPEANVTSSGCYGCTGSGHILVEAYKVLKAIYEERGFRRRDIPQQILKHNLFGLDIDDRAGQLAGFALMMLAREDDRRLFGRVADGEVTLNILSLQETGHLNLPRLWQDLNLSGDWQQGSSQSLFESEQIDLSSASADERYQLLQRALERFEQAKIFGSLIEVPEKDAEPLKALVNELEQLARSGDSMQKPAAEILLPYVRQAWILAKRYDAVIANPPYISSKGMSSEIKKFVASHYPDAKSDLFAVFIERGFKLGVENSLNAQVTLQTWMFLNGFESFRENIVRDRLIHSVMQIGYNSFPELNSKIVQCAALIAGKKIIKRYKGSYLNLNSAPQAANKRVIFFSLEKDDIYLVEQSKFLSVPGVPIAFWITETLRKIFENSYSIEKIAPVRQGFQTGDNDKFLRLWHEVNTLDIKLDSKNKEDVWKDLKKWVPYNKGGEYRKWFGNNEYIVAFDRASYDQLAVSGNCLPSKQRYFKKAITWSSLTSSHFGARLSPAGFTFSAKGACAFPSSDADFSLVCSLLNSEVARRCLEFLAPTLDFNVGDIRKIPIRVSDHDRECLHRNFLDIQVASKEDWDNHETSWEFSTFPILKFGSTKVTIRDCYKKSRELWNDATHRVQELEKSNNRIFADAYGLNDEITGDVPLNEVTLTCNPHYYYGRNKAQVELETMLRCDTIVELLSYAAGCMMGRYSLDKSGLILASQGETIQDYFNQMPSPSFAPDENAILPLTDQEWFSDDATNRFREFIRTVWGEEHLQENLDFVAESLSLHAIKPKRGESAPDTIRRYLSTQFYKDHLRTYKKRPIYWLFSSGKQKAFECLVYLHRYNESTLARMRTEYVIPLSAKLNAYADKLEQDKDASTSTAETKRLEKEVATLHKQQTELAEFDEKLRHYADRRISLDLDDGVKVNYGKFGDLLAEVKDVTGKKAT